jgi:TonB family protein
MRCLFAVAGVLLLVSLLSAQNPSALNPPPPQTARQALIEMFFGTAANHLEKHLPDVTRKTLRRMDSGNGQSFLSDFSMFASQAKAGGAALQTFDTGPTLLTAEGPDRELEKVEITVERDDLVGEEDQIELALHITRGAKEEALPFIPHFTFSMKMESEVWRLNEISVAVRLPLADPDFLKTIEDRQRSQNEQMTMWSVQQVTYAEKSYNSAHNGFACSLSSLGNSGKQLGGASHGYLIDPQLANGKKNAYIFAISGCDGSAYKIVAEPASPDSGQRAFCSDESGAIRSATDGRATTCLSSGETVEGASLGSSTGVTAPAPSAMPAPRQQAESGRPAPPQALRPQRIRVSQGVSQSLVVSRVQPVYPPDAKAARIQGQVVLQAVISKTGDVSDLQVVSGDPLLTPAAVDAVKQWRYKPYILNGNSVEVDTQVTVNFTLSEP